MISEYARKSSITSLKLTLEKSNIISQSAKLAIRDFIDDITINFKIKI